MSKKSDEQTLALGCLAFVWSILVICPMWGCLLFSLMRANEMPTWSWVLFWCYCPAHVVGVFIFALVRLAKDNP